MVVITAYGHFSLALPLLEFKESACRATSRPQFTASPGVIYGGLNGIQAVAAIRELLEIKIWDFNLSPKRPVPVGWSVCERRRNNSQVGCGCCWEAIKIQNRVPCRWSTIYNAAAARCSHVLKKHRLQRQLEAVHVWNSDAICLAHFHTKARPDLHIRVGVFGVLQEWRRRALGQKWGKFVGNQPPFSTLHLAFYF